MKFYYIFPSCYLDIMPNAKYFPYSKGSQFFFLCMFNFKVPYKLRINYEESNVKAISQLKLLAKFEYLDLESS